MTALWYLKGQIEVMRENLNNLTIWVEMKALKTSKNILEYIQKVMSHLN